MTNIINKIKKILNIYSFKIKTKHVKIQKYTLHNLS